MRELNTQELTTVTGAASAPNPLALIKGILTSKGISISVDKTAHTVTITTPKGSKTITLPSLPMGHLPVIPTPTPAPTEEPTGDA